VPLFSEGARPVEVVMRRFRFLAFIGVTLVVLVLSGLTWVWVGAWQVRDGLAWARRRMRTGEIAAARDRLARLSAWCPRDGELEYLLGVCEAELKRPDAAVAAWARVPGSSPAAGAAARASGRVLVRAVGRLTDAEAAYRAAAHGTGAIALQACWDLTELLIWEGRLDEARRLLQEISRIGQLRDRTSALRGIWRLDLMIVAAEEVQPVLEQAARHAADDDRAWLARAFLATRYGRYAEARRWLGQCQERRPDDPVVWRAVLQWALAAGHAQEARRALSKVPADRLTVPEQWSLRAELAAQRNDPDGERLALEQLIEVEPGHTRALDRLAALALQRGQADRAAALRRRQEEALRDKERYRWLLVEDRAPVPRDELHERARLAERLGRWFEARGWLTLALERDPGDRSARASLDRLAGDRRVSDATMPAAGVSLLDLLRASGGAAAATVAEVPAASGRPAPDIPRRAVIAFRDDADSAGLRFTYDNGETPEHPIPETLGGGVAVLDYDGDGWLDVYLVQGGPFPPCGPAFQAAGGHGRGARVTPGDRLFRNRGDGTFADVTAAAGIERIGRGYAFGVTAGDYDGDGRPDLFITRFGAYVLLHNQGDGTFADVTERAGLGGPRDWPTSAAFADLDADGDLDLYVCHYLAWDAEHPTLCRNPDAPERHVSCLPLRFSACPDHLFRNDGGRFVDVTAQAGIVDPDGRGLGVVAVDLDDDGRIDLYVANDMTANRFFHNRGNLRFEEIGHMAGVACNAEGCYQAGMGIACGDLDGDGRPDLAVTNFFGESTSFYRNLGQGMFTDATVAVGLKAASRFLLGFGITFLDVDNDGWLDLASANGYIHDLRPKVPYAMPAQLLVGDRNGGLTDVSEQSGAPWGVPRIGRGLAVADLDNDGRMDLLLVAQNSPLAYFHNQTEAAGHFLTLRLEGTASNRDAIGARVTISAGAQRQTAWRLGGGSYASASDPRLHFGLGPARRIDEIEVRWPSGRVDRFHDLPSDAGYRIREGAEKVSPLVGFGVRKSSS
jgi:tetratricopeptide (TPR) repeat protein